ncbi:MAG: ATP phosphoribosyltransferase regulatory subunit [Thermoleophilaceae bacterium]|nr:ATP phosphoribosyltransferase regulatory subunit [Thermoleophilaceae bacterium]
MSSTDNTRSGGASVPETIPVPMGTRDVLPEEMAELREISARALDVFTKAGYGEIATPALEYEETMRLAGTDFAENVYRVPDKDGQVLTLRFDSTVPIARLAATRYRSAEPPLRFCYMQHVYRAIEPKRAQSRQFLQIGMELLGLPAQTGDAEAVELLVSVLRAAGLTDFKIAVGDVAFFAERLAAAGIKGSDKERVLHEMHTRDLVGYRHALSDIHISASDQAGLETLALARGGRDLLEAEGAEQLLKLDDLLTTAGVSDRVIYDLGLVRPLSYYTGTVLEVFAPSSGFPLGGGGRYDNLVGRFGRDLAAFGFSLNMERLHLAVIAEQEANA